MAFAPVRKGLKKCLSIQFVGGLCVCVCVCVCVLRMVLN